MLRQVFDTLAESTSDEKKLLAGQKAKLEAEQGKLLQAHYADAIPLDLLKTEQDRIRASLQAITSRLDTLETTYDKAKVGLDAILGLLTDIGDVYAKAEPSERRMFNRALFDRITIDDEDDATLQPTEAIQTILATNPRPHNERTLPRDDAGQGSNVQLYVDLAEGLSKLAPPVIQMVRAHQSIRAGRHRTHSRRRHPQRAPRASEDVLQRAEAAYAAGGSLKAVARQVGLGHERLSRLLRERGVVLRNHSPSSSEIRLMRAMYDQGASLERVGGKFGYTVGTVRKHLLIAGVMIRDTHGR